jgi:hypothetical protein
LHRNSQQKGEKIIFITLFLLHPPGTSTSFTFPLSFSSLLYAKIFSESVGLLIKLKSFYLLPLLDYTQYDGDRKLEKELQKLSDSVVLGGIRTEYYKRNVDETERRI